MSERNAEIEAFVAERNAMLERGDLVELRAFMAKWSPEAPPLSDEVALITLHKSRTGAVGLSLDMRKKSNRWLFDRGLESFDPSVGEHEWIDFEHGEGRMIKCCKQCGIVKRGAEYEKRAGPNKPCRGHVAISLRQASPEDEGTLAAQADHASQMKRGNP